MKKLRAILRKELDLALVAFLYKLHQQVLLAGGALLAVCLYATHVVGWRILAAWPLLLATASILLLGIALWLRARREDKAIERDIRQAIRQTDGLIADAKRTIR